jgi:hypothetical protein
MSIFLFSSRSQIDPPADPEEALTSSVTLAAVLLASQCLFALREYTDCISLATPILSEIETVLSSTSKYTTAPASGMGYGNGSDAFATKTTAQYLPMIQKQIATMQSYSASIAPLAPSGTFDNSQNASKGVSSVSALLCIIGKCLDATEFRARALQILSLAFRLDVMCIDAVMYMINNGIVSAVEKKSVLRLAMAACASRQQPWLQGVYR